MAAIFFVSEVTKMRNGITDAPLRTRDMQRLD
jgi:hypothetical protein